MNGNESLMDLFRDPETIHSLTMGEKMAGSAITMVLGLGITFTVLILIWVFIALMGRVLEAANKPKNAPADAKATPAQAEAAAPVEAAADTADESLIAVISAAIAACEGTSADNLVVRKITRLSGDSTPWAASAGEARMATRRMY